MISSLKDLEKLLKLCRKQGVTEIELDKVKLKLGDLPKTAEEIEAEADDPYKDFPVGELTPEQLMFYSSGGTPDSDPALKETA